MHCSGSEDPGLPGVVSGALGYVEAGSARAGRRCTVCVPAHRAGATIRWCLRYGAGVNALHLHSPLRLGALLALLLAFAVGLAACGGSSESGAAAAGGGGKPGVVSAAAAWDEFDSGSAIMVDVREPGELAEQNVPGTIDIPLGQLESRLAEVPTGKPVLVLCRSGNRARPAAETLATAGYDVSIVDGGILAWDAAGLPYEGSPPA
jgi:rhodanese-related sulfurtransferase